nr:RNA 2'-phosphotransferase [Aquihabitans sp. G128]
MWHGTSIAAIESIAASGLDPAARTHVHLAPAVDAKVGKRASVDLVLEVSPSRLAENGLPVFRAPNGVLLVRSVPPQAVVGLRATSARGHDEVARARALFGLPPTLDDR